MAKSVQKFSAMESMVTAFTPQAKPALQTTSPATAELQSDIERFKANCKKLAGAASAFDAAEIKLGEFLPPLLLEAGLSGALVKPTALALARHCLVMGGMQVKAVESWIENHESIIRKAFASIRDTLVDAGVTGLKATPAKVARAPKQPAASAEPAPDMISKPSAAPKGSPLASDIAMILSTANEAALSAAWESLPASTKAMVMKAFSL